MSQNKYTDKLAGTSVLIIGGTSGLGFGLAEALIEHKVSHLYISSSRQAKVDTTIERLQKSYPDSSKTTTIKGIAANLGDESTLEQNIKQLFQSLDGRKLDHVVYTAGDPLAAKPLGEVDFKFLKQAGMVRFFAPFLVAKEAALSHMNPDVASSITLTTGSIAERPRAEWAVVASYAAGLQGMVRNLALEVKPMRVNLISPGAVDTELWENTLGSAEEARKVIAGVKDHMMTGQVGQVQDVVEAYLYVMKDKNATGAMVATNGGGPLL